MRYTGDPKVCCIKGCDRPTAALNLCGAHWRRNRRYGGPVAEGEGAGRFRGKSAAERFDLQVIKGAGCWGWRGGKDLDGYPIFRADFDGVGYSRAHRWVYAAFHGEHPGDRLVCHRCDNPTCSNPAHLFLGSNAENMADKMAKGRHRTVRGEERPNAKLTEAQAIAIRADQRAYADIAAEYAVSVGAVASIKSGHSWAHLDTPLLKRGRAENRKGKSDRITPEIVREIRASTEPGKSLAERYGISPQNVSTIRKRRSWAHID